MDDLVEAILEALFEIPLDAAMESKRLKTGVKTAVFCFFGGAVTAFFGCLTVLSWMDGDVSAAWGLGCVTLLLLALVVFGGIYGHKRQWKK